MCFSVLYCEIPKTSQHLENCSRPSFYNSKKLDQPGVLVKARQAQGVLGSEMCFLERRIWAIS